MERKAFLKSLGLVGAASLIPFKSAFSGTGSDDDSKPTSCTLIPTETDGPFPLDLTENTYYFRNNITEDRTGAPVTIKIKILGQDNCTAMTNVRVNIWHCDKDGIYSGYAGGMNQGGSTDTKWLRGYQMTDANGMVAFTSIFPGWYSGRLCHIHFKVTVSSGYAAISQMTFDIPTKNALYAANSGLYTKGSDPMTVAENNVFSDGVTYQTATLTGNPVDGYETYLEVTVSGSGTGGTGTGIGHVEKENAKQFSLGQNYPNPHSGITTIPFTLVNNSNITFEIYDLSGRKVKEIDQGKMAPGDHNVTLNLASLGITHANYVYQIQVENTDGIFRECKMMTAL